EHVSGGIHASSGACGSRLRAAGAAAGAGRGRAIYSVRGAARPCRGLRSRQGGDRRDAAILLDARSASAVGQGGVAEGGGVVAAPAPAPAPPLGGGGAPGGRALMPPSGGPSPLPAPAGDATARARRYGEAGANELVLTFAGRRAEADMQYLANAARRSG